MYILIELVGIFFFAVAGSLMAARRGFDILGSAFLGGVCGLGGLGFAGFAPGRSAGVSLGGLAGFPGPCATRSGWLGFFAFDPWSTRTCWGAGAGWLWTTQPQPRARSVARERSRSRPADPFFREGDHRAAARAARRRILRPSCGLLPNGPPNAHGSHRCHGERWA